MFSSRSISFRIGLVLAAIAAVLTLVHIILSLVGITGDDFWGYALLILFVLALIFAFIQYAQERPALQSSGTAVTGFVSGALKLTSGAHPAVQGWYAWFLQNTVTPNAGLFSFLVSWGEVAVGLGLLLGLLTGIAAGFGILMNMNFLLAGAVSINPVLGMLGLFLCLSWRVCGWIGVDSQLLPALGLPWKPGVWFRSPGTVAPPAVTQS